MKLSKLKDYRTIRIVVSVGFVIGAIITLWSITSNMESYQSDYDKNDIAIHDLQEELDSLNTEKAATEEEVAQALHSVSDLGMKVASLQTKYGSLDSSTQKEAFDENVNALDACFTEDSKNARVPWYVPTKENAKSTWNFKSTYSFSSDSLNVIWLCTLDGSDDVVLAYCIGTYDVADGLFSDVTYGNTMIGMSYIDKTGEDVSESAVTPEDIQELVDELNSIDPGTDGTQSDEELNDIREAQEKLRKQEQGKE